MTANCNTCCCETDSIRMGETNYCRIDFAAFAMPIGGKGITCGTTFSIERIHACAPNPLLAVTAPLLAQIPANQTLVDNLATQVVVPAGSIPLFKHLPLFGTPNGTVTITTNGNLTYTPNAGYSGYDRFYYEVSDGVNAPRIGEVIVAVNPSLPAPALPAPVAVLAAAPLKVLPTSVQIDTPSQSVSFAMQASAIAIPGDVYRLHINQPAMNCDGVTYNDIRCYDVTITKC